MSSMMCSEHGIKVEGSEACAAVATVHSVILELPGRSAAAIMPNPILTFVIVQMGGGGDLFVEDRCR